jgi:hypothetical protein
MRALAFAPALVLITTSSSLAKPTSGTTTGTVTSASVGPCNSGVGIYDNFCPSGNCQCAEASGSVLI